jgi:glycosyltransferase involved in cell wall biosynthesis
MASICYLSRTSGRHDAHWVTTLREGGHHVSAYVVGDPDGFASAGRQPFDLVVAGPLTDAAASAVDAVVAPVLGLSWGFDLLLEVHQPGVRARLQETVRRLSRVHVDSHALAADARELGMPADRISVAPWGIDVGFFCPGVVSADPVTGWSVRDRVLFSARSWEPMYDVPSVVRGFAEALTTLPDLRLVLGGQGSQAPAIRALIESLGIEQHIHLPGPLTRGDILGWLRRSALYVSASRSDGTSLSLLEALAVGLPCVVSDLPSNREWLGGEELGRLFPVGDPHALAVAITQQLSAPADADAVAKRRGVVLARGDWSSNRTIFLAGVERAMEEPR